MIGSNGDRVLRAALPHVDAWNTWYTDYSNTPDRFAALNQRISDLAEDAGRVPTDVARSACALVVIDRDAGERPIDRGVVPLEGQASIVADGIRALAQAGADEAILVLSPINERSIRSMGEVLTLVD